MTSGDTNRPTGPCRWWEERKGSLTVLCWWVLVGELWVVGCVGVGGEDGGTLSSSEVRLVAGELWSELLLLLLLDAVESRSIDGLVL